MAAQTAARRDELVQTAPTTAAQRRAARRSLLDQIARLERELAGLVSSAWPRSDLPVPTSTDRTAGAAARLLALGELERARDDLIGRVTGLRRALNQRTAAEEAERVRIEALTLDPAGHRWERVRSASIGETGCRTWEVRPRLGLLGMLMGWWRVRISSGCPLPRPGMIGGTP